MAYLDLIASAVGHNDETPNTELAEQLANIKNKDAIKEIVGGLSMDKAVANDCIKVLYEVGEREPHLIAPYVDEFIKLISSKNNRLVWGGMTALAQIAPYNSTAIYENLDKVYSAYDKGSVITRDQSISVFAELCKAHQSYAIKIQPILINHLAICRAKEIPQHVERMSICFTAANVNEYRAIVQSRFGELTKAQQARVNKVFMRF